MPIFLALNWKFEMQSDIKIIGLSALLLVSSPWPKGLGFAWLPELISVKRGGESAKRLLVYVPCNIHFIPTPGAHFSEGKEFSTKK